MQQELRKIKRHNNNNKSPDYAIILCLICILSTLLTGCQLPIPGSTSGDSSTYTREQIINHARPAVVQINVTAPHGNNTGSGVILNTAGYIVTNDHVIHDGNRYQVVLFDGTKLSSTLVGASPKNDLAILKVQPTTQLTAIQMGDSSQLQVGQDILVIGNPLGITQTVTSGIISALNRNISEGAHEATIHNAIQTDAAINPGNSGGAMIDRQGNLIGIPTLAVINPEFNTPANGVGFAIPSNNVKSVMEQIIKSHSP
jgi:S1-C subfamily serine protease